MTRSVIKIGDLFEVKFEDSKGYFQYIANDETQLNAPVIRAFCGRYQLDEEPSSDEIARDFVDFFAHTFIKTGIRVDCWEKYGNSKEIGDLNNVFFRQSRDYGRRKVDVSYDWEVWQLNGSRIHVGPLPAQYHSAEIGGVEPPYLIVERMKNGRWTYPYPAFE